MKFIEKIIALLILILNFNVCSASYSADKKSWKAISRLTKNKFYTAREKSLLFTACDVQYSSKLISMENLNCENNMKGQEFVDKIEQGYVAPVAIKLVNPQVGYGVFAKKDIKKGDFIGDFTGKLTEERFRATAFYLVGFMIDFRQYVIDASSVGNEMRFLNDGQAHSNCTSLCVVAKDNLPHHIITAKENIKRGDQLTLTYDDKYWNKPRPHAFQDLTVKK